MSIFKSTSSNVFSRFLGALVLLGITGLACATPLHEAVASGDVEAVRQAINKRDLRARTADGSTAMHIAAWKADIDVARILLEAGATLRRRDKNNMRPLHCAIASGRSELARWMIEQGAPVDDWSDIGTPIMVAIMANDLATARVLVKRRASLAARTNLDATLIHLAAERGHARMIDFLLAQGASPDLWMPGGTRPIHLAAGNGHTAAAERLLKAGVNVESRDSNHLTPMHYAAKFGDASVVKWLVDQGANPSPPDRDGDTPLHIAAIGNFTEVARVLLAAGAKPVKNQYGLYPVQIAEQMGHREIIAFFKSVSQAPIE